MNLKKAIEIMASYGYKVEDTGYYNDNSYYISNNNIKNKYMTKEDIIYFVENFLI